MFLFLAVFLPITTPVLCGTAGAEQLTKLKTIILDPGHSGRDFGARSRNLLLEKDVSRKLALTIKEIVERENGGDVKVYLTHAGTTDADQAQRAYVANSRKGDVYISIHTSSGFDQPLPFLGIYLSEKSDGGSIEWKKVNGNHFTKSAVLAKKFETSLANFYPHKSFRVIAGSFLPLHGIDMPGLIVEAVALNDPKDELMINNDENYYKNLGEKIYQALYDYDRIQ